MPSRNLRLPEVCRLPEGYKYLLQIIFYRKIEEISADFERSYNVLHLTHTK